MTDQEKVLIHALSRIANASWTDKDLRVPLGRMETPASLPFLNKVFFRARLGRTLRFYRRGKVDAYQRVREIAMEALKKTSCSGNAIPSSLEEKTR